MVKKSYISRRFKQKYDGEEMTASKAKKSIEKWRFQIPPVAANRLQRPELMERLQNGVVLPVTILSAPAGYGKTTTLSQWAAEAKQKVGWLTLDHYDNDPAVFLEHFVTVMQTIQPGLGKAVFAMLQADKKPKMEEVLKKLLDDVALVLSDFVIILDDYHLINSRPVHAMMTYLLTYLPPQMHVVVVSQADPPFGELARHRSYERLMEIRTPYFGFSVDEAELLLKQQFQVMLPYGPISAIVESATSRPIAINYTALTLSGDDKPVSFVDEYEKKGGDSLVFPFDSLFNKLSESEQELLRDLSILGIFDTVIAASVSGNPAAGNAIRSLAETDRFVEFMNKEEGWYRIHPLVQEQLHLRLHKTGMQHLETIHLRAGAAYQQSDMPFEAFFHYAEAGAFGEAAGIIEACATEWLKSGRMLSVLNWLKRMPEEALQENPRLAITSAWVSIIGGDLGRVESYLVIAEASPRANEVAEDIDAIRHFLSRQGK